MGYTWLYTVGGTPKIVYFEFEDDSLIGSFCGENLVFFFNKWKFWRVEPTQLYRKFWDVTN